MVSEKLEILIKELITKFDEISSERKLLLENFANYIELKLSNKEKINLNFICTHNSRRSHMCQIWAQTAAEYYGIASVYCFSGGTEATAFNPRAVEAARNAGFIIESESESNNPIYLVHFSNNKDPLKCFSKIYNDDFNPHEKFAAIMTCNNADENCPIVFGSEARFPIRYDDPKEFDDTELESEKYKERFEQIGIEMIYVFSQINK